MNANHYNGLSKGGSMNLRVLLAFSLIFFSSPYSRAVDGHQAFDENGFALGILMPEGLYEGVFAPPSLHPGQPCFVTVRRIVPTRFTANRMQEALQEMNIGLQVAKTTLRITIDERQVPPPGSYWMINDFRILGPKAACSEFLAQIPYVSPYGNGKQYTNTFRAQSDGSQWTIEGQQAKEGYRCESLRRIGPPPEGNL
jgi:hypothetical protein